MVHRGRTPCRKLKGKKRGGICGGESTGGERGRDYVKVLYFLRRGSFYQKERAYMEAKKKMLLEGGEGAHRLPTGEDTSFNKQQRGENSEKGKRRKIF